eukprot:8390812-Pyramimonas_sp.AAC.2
MEGVVFLDGNDAKMVLMRSGMKVIKLEQCGIAKDKRLSFYDQVERHPPVTTRACNTLKHPAPPVTGRDQAKVCRWQLD